METRQYKVCGAMKTTGEDAEAVIRADSEAEASSYATSNGMMVSEVVDVTPAVIMLSEKEYLAKIEGHLSRIAFWCKFFGVIAIIYLICLVLFGNGKR